MEHPMQPIYLDEHGVARFLENKIVGFLLRAGPYDMNKISCMNFSDSDREQFAQLIGYSVSGVGELEYVRDEVIEKADAFVESLLKPSNEVSNVELRGRAL